MGFQFVDTSTNGPGGGPLQNPSAPFFLYFQADVTIAAIGLATTELSLTFAAPSHLSDQRSRITYLIDRNKTRVSIRSLHPFAGSKRMQV